MPPGMAVAAFPAPREKFLQNEFLDLCVDRFDFQHFRGNDFQFLFIQLLEDLGGIFGIEHEEEARQFLHFAEGSQFHFGVTIAIALAAFAWFRFRTHHHILSSGSSDPPAVAGLLQKHQGFMASTREHAGLGLFITAALVSNVLGANDGVFKREFATGLDGIED